MDGNDALLHGGSNAISVAIGWGVSRFLAWRKEERTEDALKVEKDRAEKRRDDDDVAFGLLRERVTKLETRTEHFEQLVAALMVELKEMRVELKEIRDDIRKDLAEHRRNVHDSVNVLSSAMLKLQVAQKKADQ